METIDVAPVLHNEILKELRKEPQVVHLKISSENIPKVL